MNFEEFTKNALRTESVITNANINMDEFQTLIDIFITVGTLLDYTKKGIFYNNYSKFDDNYIPLVERLNDQVSELLESGRKDHVNVEQSDTLNFRVVHGLLGCMTESVEIAEHLLTHLSTGEIDAIGIQEEFNDFNYYQALGHDELGLNFEKGLENVISKLRIRYPDKFDEVLAANRNLEAERRELEK